MAKGISADYYHAGQGLSERKSIQGAWQRGDVSVVCATIAYGMGIDKANVRFVWMPVFLNPVEAVMKRITSTNEQLIYCVTNKTREIFRFVWMSAFWRYLQVEHKMISKNVGLALFFFYRCRTPPGTCSTTPVVRSIL